MSDNRFNFQTTQTVWDSITLEEFEKMIVPRDNENLKASLYQRDTNYIPYFPKALEQELSLFIHTENAFHESMYAKRLILQSRHDFSTYACFAVIDDWKEGHVSRQNMLRFMMRNGYAMSEPELAALFRRLAE